MKKAEPIFEGSAAPGLFEVYKATRQRLQGFLLLNDWIIDLSKSNIQQSTSSYCISANLGTSWWFSKQ